MIRTERGEFNVHLYGDPAHPPFIALHGWPQTGYCWHHTAQHLEGLYLVAPDFRGMGDSNRALEVERYEKHELAKDIFAIADAMNINSFYLAGHDWGGAIVQEMVMVIPDRIRKLIVLNMIIINNAIGMTKASEIMIGQMYRSSWYQFFQSIPKFPEALLAGKEDVWVRFFSRGISNPIPEDALREYTRCYQIPNTITTAANLYRTFKKDRERWATYQGNVIDIPTKIIHGDLDPVIIPEYLEGVDQCFSEVEISHISAGHFVIDEQPQLVGEEIRKFLIGS